MKKPLIAIALFALTATLVTFYPSLESAATTQSSRQQPSTGQINPLPAVAAPPEIEIVFALDTTGSMGGLIHAAKEKIWSIATTMAQTDPAPQIRIGFVAYRDRGDAYVTQVVDLSTDLDSVYARLMDFQAHGGGDGPEAVNQALHDAVHKISWSKGKTVYRAIFLVGDAPPHMDYNEPQYPQIAGAGLERGIVINTIRCGNNANTGSTWRHIASLGNGDFFDVGQDGNAVAIATPFDEEIAKLSVDLDHTRLVYGDAAVHAKHAAKQSATAKLHAESSVASRARRAAFNTSDAAAGNLMLEHDLVEAHASGKVAVDTIAEEALPASLRALAPAARIEAVRETAKERKALSEKLTALAEKRDQFIEQKLEAEGGADDSFDLQLFDVVKRQAADLGISYEGGAKY